LGWESEAALVDKSANAVRIVYLPRNENPQVIGQAEQAAVEHPMHGAGKGNSVADDIGTIRFDRTDMGRGDFGAPLTVDQSKAADRTAL
jgi:hypothetical protein